MRYQELFEYFDDLDAYWFNTETNQLIQLEEGSSHAFDVIYKPEKYGFSRNELAKYVSGEAKKALKPGAITIDNLPDISLTLDGDPDIIQLMLSKQWVRIVVSDDEISIDSNDTKKAAKAAKFITNMYPEIDNVFVSISQDGLKKEKYDTLSGKRLELFMKTRNFPSKRIHEDVFRKAPCAPTAIQRVTGASDEEIIKFCQKYNWSPKLGMNVGQVIKVLKSLGFDYESKTPLMFYKVKHDDGRIFTKTRTLNQLLKVLPDGKFLVTVNGHLIAVIDREIFDDANFGLKHKVLDIIKVVDGGNKLTENLSKTKLELLRPQLAKAAQKVYDSWHQDDEGYDEELGVGGICQDIADAMADVLSREGYDVTIVDSQGVGEQHVWVVVKTDNGVYSVDIPPYVYETGGGFTWRKKKDIEFDGTDVELYKISADPNEFENYIDN